MSTIVLPPKASIYLHQTTAKEMGISEDEYKIQEALGLIPKIVMIKYQRKLKLR